MTINRTCTKCNKIKLSSEFNKHSKGPQGLQWWCRVCANNKRLEWEIKNPIKCRAKWAQPKHRFCRMRNNALKRGISFELTLTEYLESANEMCNYCGGNLPEFGGGLDRVDSNIGYIKDNLVACCYKCNVMKSNLTQQEFFSHVKKIISFKGLNHD